MEQWLSEHDTSPCTGSYLHSKHLLSNHALRNAINEWRRGETLSSQHGSSGSVVAHGHGAVQISPHTLLAASGASHKASPEEAARANAEKRRTEVERQYRKRLEEIPDDVGTLCKLGALLRYSGNVDGAVFNYRLALRSNPSHLATLFNLGSLLLEDRGDVKGAEEMYLEALIASPNDTPTLCNLAVLYQTFRNDAQQAEVLFRRALAGEPNSVPTLFNLANLLLDDCGVRRNAWGSLAPPTSVLHELQTQETEAEMFLRRAVKTDPHDSSTLRALGKVVAGKGSRMTTPQDDSASEGYTDLNHDDGNAAAPPVNSTSRTNNLDEAEHLLRRAVAADDGTDADSLVALADFLWSHRHDPQRAETLYVEALVIAPACADAYSRLAIAWLCWRTPNACKFWICVLSIGFAVVAACVQA
eukprot:gene8675-28579_t